MLSLLFGNCNKRLFPINNLPYPSNAEVSGGEAVRRSDWLDFAFVNIVTIGDSEDKDIKTQQGIYHPVVTDAIFAKPAKLSLEYRIGFRLFDQFLLNEVKDSSRLGFR
jgi:hypothetical protein